MVTVVSKLLLLVALLNGIENAVSREDSKSRRLSFERLPRSLPHPPLDIVGSGKSSKSSVVESEDIEEEKSSFLSAKSEKASKSGLLVKSEKASKSGSGKAGKKSYSKKGGKSLKADGDLTVAYKVVETYKSGKSKGKIPDFEFIDVVDKSIKSSKGESSEKESDGSKIAKYDSGSGVGKSMKSDGGSDVVKSTKSDDGSNVVKSTKSDDGSDAVKSTKSSDESDGVKSAKSDTNASARKSSKAGGSVRKVPPPSPPPTDEGTFGVGVPVYSLVYKLRSNLEPTVEELNELNEATASYLDDYFINEFDEDDFTIYSQFVNEIEGATSSSNSQVVVSYDSIVRFGQLSLIKPMPKQLGSAIGDAFTGLKMIQYENWLTKILPESNVFVGSKVQYFDGDAVPDTSRIGMAGIAASAAAMTLLVAGAVLYKSKANKKEESDVDTVNKSPGDMTVAGETYAGETYDGSASVAVSMDHSRKMNDEEGGMMIESLGSTPETGHADSKGGIFRLAPSKLFNAFRTHSKSAPTTSSFQDVALQAPASGDRYQDTIMPEPSSSEDDESDMSDSELSQFVANQISGGHTLEIKSILSQDSMDENTSSDLAIRDNSSRRMRTVAEIEALLSSELEDDNSGSGSRTSRSTIQAQLQMGRPRTVEEIESLLTAEDDDSVDASIDEC